MVTGDDLRAARQSQQVSLGRLAQLIGRDKGHLSRVENGGRDITPALVRDYEQALGVVVAATTATDGRPAEDVTVSDVQRGILGLIAAASVGAARLDPVGRLLEGVTPALPRQAGVSEIEAIESATRLYMGLDLAHGGGMAGAVASSSLRWAIGLLECQMVDDTRARLSSAIGLLADRVGWAIYDRGEKPKAEKLLTFALSQAARGPDRDLRAHIMLDLSSVLTDSGRPLDGVEVLRMALGDERISSAERANLHAVCARHCASAGLRQAGLRHVDLAEDTLARDEPALGPEWAARITTSTGHHDSALGLALFALGDEKRARDRLAAAVARLDAGRTRTGLRCRTRLAILHLRQGDRDEAERQARQVMADAAEVRSTRVTGDVNMLLTEIRGTGLRKLADELSRTGQAA